MARGLGPKLPGRARHKHAAHEPVLMKHERATGLRDGLCRFCHDTEDAERMVRTPSRDAGTDKVERLFALFCFLPCKLHRKAEVRVILHPGIALLRQRQAPHRLERPLADRILVAAEEVGRNACCAEHLCAFICCNHIVCFMGKLCYKLCARGFG